LVILDEIHVTVLVPRRLPDAEAAVARRTLNGKHFLASLGRAVREYFRRHPALARTRVRLGR
jgi:hypothetical protein